MKIKRFRVSKPKKYTDKQGQEKTQWHNIGTMTVFVRDDGSVSRKLEIPAIDLEAQIYEIEDKPKQDSSRQQQAEQAWNSPQQEVRLEDVPF